MQKVTTLCGARLSLTFTQPNKIMQYCSSLTLQPVNGDNLITLHLCLLPFKMKENSHLYSTSVWIASSFLVQLKKATSVSHKELKSNKYFDWVVSLGFPAFCSFAAQLEDQFYIVLHESGRKHVQDILAVG